MGSNHLNIELKQEQLWIEQSKKSSYAFEPLYNKYYQPIFRYIYRRTDDHDLASDICSQTFFKALSNIRKFEWQGKPLAPWLYRIAANELKKHFRDRKEIFLIEEEKLLATEDLAEDWMRIRQTDNLRIVLGQLTETEVRIIELKYFEEHTFTEMSMILEIKESALKMRLYRLLQKIKQNLDQYVPV
ncbi:MAG: sigma-70 family RNA polymerase sigma factor [Marinoscillum sp.]